MSGGSHHYLYACLEATGALGGVSSYECMESSLRADGHAQAADRVLDLIAHLKAAEAIARELRDVMHDQEWADSHDLCVEDVCATVATWVLSTQPSHAPRRYRFPERCERLLEGPVGTMCALAQGHKGACAHLKHLYAEGRGHEAWPGK
jgi:hypothetical protein